MVRTANFGEVLLKTAFVGVGPDARRPVSQGPIRVFRNREFTAVDEHAVVVLETVVVQPRHVVVFQASISSARGGSGDVQGAIGEHLHGCPQVA